ncbi:hypothetical protein QTP70_034988 [Hemibagrus guttatus]|uniref:Secreted protein n=1 Tax=Hemibagrus guttatus TaxID=175788 RepID=A0AAE0QW76_9TELE|nr:hypothetical protein QTP70_034988 [Hemibagrus guttatus]
MMMMRMMMMRMMRMLMMIVFVLERHLQAKKALQRPEKLLVEFQTVNGSLEGLFSWQVSEATPGQTPITGFQFSWVKVSSRCVNKSPDTSLISQTLNLAPAVQSIILNIQSLRFPPEKGFLSQYAWTCIGV